MFDVFIFFHFSIHNQQTQVKSKVKFCRDGYIVTLASCNASFWQEALLHQYFVLARDCLMHHRRRTAVHNTEGASAPALGLCSGLCFSSQPPGAAMFPYFGMHCSKVSKCASWFPKGCALTSSFVCCSLSCLSCATPKPCSLMRGVELLSGGLQHGCPAISHIRLERKPASCHLIVANNNNSMSQQ